MSDEIQIPARQADSRTSRVVRAIAEDSKRSFWALTDQAVVSLGNFALHIVLARHFAIQHNLASYGAFMVLMELMFFFNGVQGAILIYPLTARGATLDSAGLRRIASQSLMLTLMAAPLLVLAVMITASAAHLPFAVGAWAGVALLAWQMQETVRRALMAHLRFRAACIGDSIRYAGQVAVVVVLSWRGTLDLERTFQAISLAAMLACLLQVTQLGLSPIKFKNTLLFARECWSVGRWVFYGNLTNLCSGALFYWNFAYWAGLELVAVYSALVNLIRPAHPLAFAVGTLITPNAARLLSTEGMNSAKAIAKRFTLFGAILLLPYLGMLLLFPRLTLAIFYGWESGYMEHVAMVRVSALAVALVYLGIASGAFLIGVGRVRQSFIGQLAHASAYLLVVMPLTAVFGLAGAIWGWFGASFLHAAINLHFCRGDSDASRQLPGEPAGAPSMQGL